MITDIFTDTGVVLRLVTVIVSVYVVVSSAEYVAAREHLRDDGIMSWRVSGRRRVFSLPVVSQLATLTMPYPRFLVVLVLRGVLGLLAIGFALRGSLVPVVLGGIAVTTFAISFRHPYGLEGGFQMAFVTVVSVFIASLFQIGSVVREIAIFFVAAQAVLSYLVAGLSKLASDAWRDGTVLVGVFGTSIYGHEWIHEYLRRRPTLDTVGCWATIGFESLFPLVLVSPGEVLVGFCALGLAFHLGTAVFMGLNGFLVPFAATYPAIIYTNHVVTTFW